MKETIFIDGLIAKKPGEKAPEYIVANLSVKVDEFTAFAQKHARNGWINITVKESKGGKFYGELDTYEPKKEEATVIPEYRGESVEEINIDEIPF